MFSVKTRLFLACTLAAVTLLTAAAGAQTTINVPADQPTIQAAIDAATSGDTILIAAGTYVESLNIDKSLTVRGVNEATVIIDARTFDDYSIDADGDHAFVFEDFTLWGHPTGSAAYGMKISGDDATVEIRRVTVFDSRRSGIDLNGLTSVVIDDVDVSDVEYGVGIGITDCSNVTLANITTASNAWGGLAIYTYGRYNTLGSDNIVLSGVNSFGEGSIYTEVGNYNDPGNPAPITNLTIPLGDCPYIYLNAPQPNHTMYAVSLAAAEAVALLSPETIAIIDRATGEFLVSDGMMIQPAIDAATAGDTVLVGAGTYREQLTIAKDLTVSGAGAGVSVVESPDAVDRTSVTVTKWTSDTELLQAVVLAQNATVHLSGLTVDGRSTGPDHYYGIYYIDAGGSVTDCAVPGVLNPAAPGSQRVVSLVATHGVGGSFDIDIIGNTIPEIQKGGIVIMGPGATFTVENNTVINAPTGANAGNGIQLAYGASGSTAGNEVEGIAYEGADWSATGILLFECGDVSMDGDYVHGCQSGVNYSDWRWIHAMAVPVNLVFENLILDGNEWPLGTQLSGDQSDLNVTITDCTITNATGDGVDIWGTGIDPWGGAYYTGWDNGDLNVDISGLVIDGVDIDGLWTDDLSGNLTNVVHSFLVRETGFMNCTQSAVNSGLGVPVDARLCWWNDVAGPVPGVKKAGDGTVKKPLPAPAGFDLPERGGAIDREIQSAKVGETIFGDILYAGWLGDLPSNLGARPWTLYTSPAAGGIGPAIEVAEDGELIDIAAGTYVAPEQIVVDKDLTLSGAGSDVTIIEPGFDTTVGSYLVSDALIYVDHDVTAIFEDLAIDGTGHVVRHAVQSRGADLTVRRCEVRDIHANTYAGRGIVYLTGTGLVEDCVMSGIQRIGVHIRGAVEPVAPVVTVDGLNYTGKGTGEHLDYGVEFGGGGGGAVVNSVITNCLGIASDLSESAGILITDYYGTGTVADVQACVLTGNEVGVAVGYAPEDLSVATLSGNTIANNNSFGVTSTGPVVDALGNWWGDPTGPLHPTLNPGGLGNAVSDNVLFDPYLTGAVISTPDPLDLTVADPVGNMDVSYLGGYGPCYGYSVTMLWDAAVATAVITRPDDGPFAAGNSLFQLVPVAGGVRVDGALQGNQPGIDLGDLFKVEFTAVGGDGTQTVVDFTVEYLADYGQPPIPGVPADDGLVRVDTGLPVVADVLITNTTIASTGWVKNGDTIAVTATVTDVGGLATVTCDLSQFGGGLAVAPDGPPVADVYTWTFTPVAGTGDALITATVTAVDGVGNTTVGSDDIMADNTAPDAVTGLAATPGHNQIHLSWDDPSGLDTNFAGVEFRYTATADYPLYAAGPAAPAADHTGGDLAFQSTVAVAHDWPQTVRDIYTLAAFAYDAAGNYGPADMADGNWDLATSYFLADTYPVPGGDGYVAIHDISRLGDTYGLHVGETGYLADCDYGPTDDYSRFGIPEPDGEIGFLDLLIAAMNFDEVSPSTKAERSRASDGAIGVPVFSWTRVDEDTWALALVSPAPGVKGLHLSARLPDGVTCTVTPGTLVADQDDPVFLRNVARNGLDAGFAVLGFGADLDGAGEVVLVKTSQPVEDLDLELSARDINNGELLAEIQQTTGAELPTVHALNQNYPNPFNPQTVIAFALPRDENVRLAVYGVDGRLVRVLVDENLEAGRHEVVWRGDDGAGRRMATGTYFYVIDAGDFHQVRKMSLVK